MVERHFCRTRACRYTSEVQQIHDLAGTCREALDSAVVHVEHHDDWHRVERAMQILELKARRDDLLAHVAHR